MLQVKAVHMVDILVAVHAALSRALAGTFLCR